MSFCLFGAYRKKFFPNYFSLLQSKTLNYKREVLPGRFFKLSKSEESYKNMFSLIDKVVH